MTKSVRNKSKKVINEWKSGTGLKIFFDKTSGKNGVDIDCFYREDSMTPLRQQVEAEARKIVRNDNFYIYDFDGGWNSYERVDTSWLESAIADALESYAKRCEDLGNENAELRKKGAE